MKKFVWALLLWPALAGAHTVDVTPVRMTLKADAGALRVTVEVNARSWSFLTGIALPEGGAPWPEDVLRSCQGYLHTHFAPSIDGKPLEGRVVGGRLAQPLWKSEVETEAVIQAVYDFPRGEEGTFAARVDFFREEWQAMEGQGARPSGEISRQFGTRLRWKPWPGGTRMVALSSPDFSLPVKELRRPAVARWGESLWGGVRAALSTGGGLCLLLAALLFPRPFRWGWAWVGAGVVAGLFWPGPASVAAGSLWIFAVLTALSSFLGAGALLWRMGLTGGAACAAALWAAEGAIFRDATSFTGFSLPWFWAGACAVLGASLPLKKGFSAFYAFHFRHLTPDELARQSLFHRRVAVVLVAVAGVTSTLSPLWTRP